MSLHRVGSIESLSFAPTGEIRSRRGSDASVISVRPTKLTFNPIPEQWDPPSERHGNVQAVGAFEVPEWKRISQVIAAVFYCFLAAGVCFGYAAIKPVLKQEGAYQDVCIVDGTVDDTCVEIHLNLMFTVAAVGTNVAALPIGIVLDKTGPRFCGLLGSAFLAAGSLMLAYSKALPFDGLLWGYLLTALGGPFIYISSFQLSNAFPKHSGLILALLTGAFDASSALYLIYRLIYQATSGGFGLKSFFLVYLTVPALIAVLQLTLLPKQSYKTVGEMIEDIEEPGRHREADDQIDEETALLREEERHQIEDQVEELLGTRKVDKQVQREIKKNERSGVWGVMHTATIKEQLMSPWFSLIMMFTVVQMTRINFFVATIYQQYSYLFHSHQQAREINNFFDLALPIGGILSIPFIGTILDRTTTVTVLICLVFVATTIGILGIIPQAWAAYGHVCLFVLYRPFYYTAVSDYSAKVFGFRTFGTVYGAVICLSGLFNLSQPALDYMFHMTFAGNPTPVNVILMSAGLLVGVALVIFVSVKAGRFGQTQQRDSSPCVERRA
ncbi:hypothetical protein MGG_15745 [Pyricularia oryzae 70-15]|uniref:FMP42 n=1 Tax=Pyricularia oryzae (strain 70-15 / ATCC MYA-4617 / FGSC 8958) TaxID=242507 RepID=G4MUC8_PYRO7|nr:uncharacterized protein MGG_15745 [Pyricularia oryzae 70-15]EHA54815.1 hypothetical protein MGG_15745 [Pyricularia oryzae 70-15]KAI7915619.1 hypothetical protein M9X92_008331 [Pyricularia oryzae]KAI7919731.1 hypothetical protein M0657_006967 [Pyricularia oryzae]